MATLRAFALLLPCILLFGVRAHADYIVNRFSGTFTRSVFDGPVVPLGSEFTGFFSYPTNGVGIETPFNGGTESRYEPVYLSLTVGPDTIVANAASVEVRNAVTLFDDHFLLVAGSEVGAPLVGTLNGHTIRLFELFLNGRIDTFSSADYPPALDAAEFQSGSVKVFSGPVQQTLLSLSLFNESQGISECAVTESLDCSTPTCTVPEPPGVSLLVSCLLLLRTAAASKQRRTAKPAR